MTATGPDAPPDTEQWTCPEELKPYLEHLSQPDRVEELYNHPATPFNNHVAWGMKLETVAEVGLLSRLLAAGLLEQEHTKPNQEAKQ